MAGLAMETSKAEPPDRNQAKAKLNRDSYVDSFPYVESYVDNNPYVESSMDRFAYKSRPAVDTTDGSAGVAGQAGAQRTISWKQMRAVSWKQMRAVSSLLVQPDEGVSDLVVDRIGDNLPQSTEKSWILVIPVGARHKCQQAGGRIRIPNKQMSTRSDAKEESESDVEQLIQMRSAKEKINQTFHEENMKQLVRKDVNNSGVESAVEEVNEPDVVVQLLTYQMLINRGESAVGTTNSKTADEIYEENQQLMSDTKKTNS
ncbi:DNA polymerase zeta catalytic subunit [Dorcoceras hygrometricum]|uniref:DNA polymerase zeta catalytic subunit n=2 Tax=Dorcoceras hygrometricum TaxID=472368 RepID=A0A2Z7C4F4_9LAMI|nr:DNA polymerase zeta catalytic subunit [Dorcoceras hygrometricum]